MQENLDHVGLADCQSLFYRCPCVGKKWFITKIWFQNWVYTNSLKNKKEELGERNIVLLLVQAFPSSLSTSFFSIVLFDPIISPSLFAYALFLRLFWPAAQDSGRRTVPPDDATHLRPLARFWLIRRQTCLPFHECPSLQNRQPVQVQRRMCHLSYLVMTDFKIYLIIPHSNHIFMIQGESCKESSY